MKMYIGGEWVDRDEKVSVLNPYDGSVIDTVPSASLNDLETALATAVRGAEAMKQLSGYQRFEILRKAADIMRSRIQDLGTTVSTEEGKILSEGLAEADRAIQTIELSGEEAKRLYGETVPLDGASNWAGQYGFTMRVPVGVVAAIAPFNFPLNLVAHKVGPALAAGNAVIIKPAIGASADGRTHRGRRPTRGSAMHHGIREQAWRPPRGGSSCAKSHLHRKPRCGRENL